MANRILIANKVFIPVELVKEELLVKHYERHLFVQQSCDKCVLFKKGIQRPGILIQGKDENKKIIDCLNCHYNSYTGFFKSWSKVTIKGNQYYSVPSGNLEKMKENLKISFKNYLDLRCNAVVKYPLKFKGQLYTGKEKINGKPSSNQIQLVKDYFSSSQSGYIQAKARSGKSVIAVYIVCKLKKPTIILVHEKLLLDQFYDHFKTKTNFEEIERKTKKRIVVVAKTEKDLQSNAPYLLVNYQKFITELGIKRVAQYLQKRYSLLITDELHRSGSLRYLDLINRLDCKRRLGLTATPDRKDGKWVLVEETFGPLLAKSSVGSMIPICYVKKTNYKPPRQWRGLQAYNKSCSFLASNKSRNIEIVKSVFSDLRKNELNSIVIPVKQVKHAKTLTRMINKQAAYNNNYKGELWPEELAEVLWSGSDKSKILDNARKFKTRVVIAIEKFVKDGIDVGAWNIMHVCFPSSNKVAIEQCTARILTPYPGKPQPILRLWWDPVDILQNCLKASYVASYIPLGYTFGSKTKELLDDLVASKKVGKAWINTKKDIGSGWGNSSSPASSIKTRG